MIIKVVFELGDRVVVDTPAKAYEEFNGKAGRVESLNGQVIGIRFDDGTYSGFSRSLSALKPENLKISFS